MKKKTLTTEAGPLKSDPSYNGPSDMEVSFAELGRPTDGVLNIYEEVIVMSLRQLMRIEDAIYNMRNLESRYDDDMLFDYVRMNLKSLQKSMEELLINQVGTTGSLREALDADNVDVIRRMRAEAKAVQP